MVLLSSVLSYHDYSCSTNNNAGLFSLYIQYRSYVRRPVHLIPTCKELPRKKLLVFESYKTFFSNSMIQEQLSALACVSIKKGILKKLQSHSTWHDGLTDKFAKKKRSTSNFPYKYYLYFIYTFNTIPHHIVASQNFEPTVRH